MAITAAAVSLLFLKSERLVVVAEVPSICTSLTAPILRLEDVPIRRRREESVLRVSLPSLLTASVSAAGLQNPVLVSVPG